MTRERGREGGKKEWSVEREKGRKAGRPRRAFAASTKGDDPGNAGLVPKWVFVLDHLRPRSQYDQYQTSTG